MLIDRKPKFRSRKLEYNKSLAVYRYDEVNDFDDYDEPIRSVAQVATGVDKEEEEEHHLKQALSHQAQKTETYYIPTPEAAEVLKDYEDLYLSSFKQSKSLVKLPVIQEDQMFSSSKYNADTADEEFYTNLINNHRIPKGFSLDIFEKVIDVLEDVSHKFSESVVTSECLEGMRDKYSDSLPDTLILDKIIDFWRERRKTREMAAVPYLKHEDLGKIGADPYVCFRRRELKIPRKTRRSDAQITERLKKLYYDLAGMKVLLRATVKRDKYKREALILEGDLFEKYVLIDNWRKHNKTTFPASVPSFKSAAQSLSEFKKRRVDNGDDYEDSALNMSGGYKIAIPIAALKHSRFVKPFYSAEVNRKIQKEMELLLGNHSSRADETRFDNELCCEYEELTGDCFYKSDILNDEVVSFRRSRCNRIVVDRSMTFTHCRNFTFSSIDHQSITPQVLRIPAAKEFASLQVPIGNYNVHAVQTANQILRPMSFAAWTAATAPLLSSLGASSKSSRSPKKRKKLESDVTDSQKLSDSSTLSSSNTTPTNTPISNNLPSSDKNGTEISKLASSNSQITVKVKREGSGIKGSSGGRRVSGGSARFTPNGLAPEPSSTLSLEYSSSNKADL